MDTSIVLPAIILAIAIISFVIAYRQSKEKGFVFNNSYLYASKEERKSKDWKAEYKQSKTAFLIVGILFCVLAFELMMGWNWLTFVVMGLVVVLVVYAIASSLNKATGK